MNARLRSPALAKAGAVREAIGRVPEPDGSASGAEAPGVEPAGAIPGGPVRTTALSADFAAAGARRPAASRRRALRIPRVPFRETLPSAGASR